MAKQEMTITEYLIAQLEQPVLSTQVDEDGKKVKKNANVVWGTDYDYLSTRYINYDDIRDYDRGQIRVLKNSIYARHGRIFKDAALREYFEQQSWYRGTRNEIPAGEFNKYENANIAFLLKYE
jgi:hypothetical protein